MNDYTLRECPFCGNPAEIIDSDPYSWLPNVPTKAITCSKVWCIGREIKRRFIPNDKLTEVSARLDWNTRRRKNRLTWKQEAENELQKKIQSR